MRPFNPHIKHPDADVVEPLLILPLDLKSLAGRPRASQRIPGCAEFCKHARIPRFLDRRMEAAFLHRVWDLQNLRKPQTAKAGASLNPGRRLALAVDDCVWCNDNLSAPNPSRSLKPKPQASGTWGNGTTQLVNPPCPWGTGTESQSVHSTSQTHCLVFMVGLRAPNRHFSRDHESHVDLRSIRSRGQSPKTS